MTENIRLPSGKNEALILRVLSDEGAEAIAADIFTVDEVERLLNAAREDERATLSNKE